MASCGDILYEDGEPLTLTCVYDELHLGWHASRLGKAVVRWERYDGGRCEIDTEDHGSTYLAMKALLRGAT